MLAIDTAGLDKTYAGLFRRGGQQALRGVDLRVPRGTAFGLIGLNGAGKTTFIKTILGIVRATAGTVRVLGGAPDDPRVRARIGYLPERLHLPQTWTPIAFLASVSRLKGVTEPRGGANERLDAEGDVRRQLARVGLDAEAQRRIGGFSKGMKQRLGLAAALLRAPDLLILDEPTDGVDPLGRAAIRCILGEERARGATLFLNSHLLSETERICDRIGILARGRLVREGALDALCGGGTRYRVRFAPGCDVAALLAAGFLLGDAPAEPGSPAGEPGPAPPGVFHCEAADPVALNAMLDRARAAGALILELSRESRDLEDVLTEAVRTG